MSFTEGISVGFEAYEAERAVVSNTPASMLMPFFEFGADVNRLRVLDVCAGTSDLTAALIEQGADAFALDYGYGDVDRLQERVNTGVRNQRFFDSFRGNPARYVQGLACELPFEDKSFDRAVSYFGILGVMDISSELLRKSLQEALRVVRDGGSLEIGPVLSGRFGREARTKVRAAIMDLQGVTLSGRIPADPLASFENQTSIAKLIISKTS